MYQKCMYAFLIHACLSPVDVEFIKALQYRFSREPKQGLLEHVYDCEVYKDHSDFFQSEYNISLGFNFDGAPKFKSSSVQLWPVQLFINELPPKMRYAVYSGMIICMS